VTAQSDATLKPHKKIPDVSPQVLVQNISRQWELASGTEAAKMMQGILAPRSHALVVPRDGETREQYEARRDQKTSAPEPLRRLPPMPENFEVFSFALAAGEKILVEDRVVFNDTQERRYVPLTEIVARKGTTGEIRVSTVKSEPFRDT
jgi:hypothetical protein